MSKMISCKACGKEIAKGVNKCVHCGKDQRNFFMKHKIITIILALAIIGGIGSAMGGDKDQASKTTSTKESTQSKPNDTNKQETKKYSFDKFMQIQMGMSYDQVKGILGEGTEESSSGDGDLKTVSYRWKNNDGSNLSVMLQGGKVVTKAQAFLKNMDAKVTLEKYNKINNGMTYEQVKGMLEDGMLMSQTELLGTKSEMYGWINSNGSNMNITFQNGKVESKAQFQLK